MKSRKHNKEFIVITSLYLASVLTFAAGALGTYAWYSYNARASAYYNGAAIGDGGSLEVGIFSDEEIEKLSNFKSIVVDKTTLNNKFIYWSNNGFTEEMIAAYCETKSYAVNQLGPTTSGPFKENDEIDLRHAPSYLVSSTNKKAKTSNYIMLPLIFRVNGVSDISILLSGISLESPAAIRQAVRVAFEDTRHNTSFVLNPSTFYDGETDVGGVLDLNNDGYYDFKNGKEYPYGFYESYSYLQPYSENIRTEEPHTTFEADHRKGIRGIDYVPEKASYYGLDNVLSRKTLAYSNSNGLVFLNTYIFVEGWDRSCITKDVGQPFKLDFEFILGGN